MKAPRNLGEPHRNRIALYLGAYRTKLSAVDLRPYFQGQRRPACASSPWRARRGAAASGDRSSSGWLRAWRRAHSRRS